MMMDYREEFKDTKGQENDQDLKHYDKWSRSIMMSCTVSGVEQEATDYVNQCQDRRRHAFTANIGCLCSRRGQRGGCRKSHLLSNSCMAHLLKGEVPNGQSEGLSVLLLQYIYHLQVCTCLA